VPHLHTLGGPRNFKVERATGRRITLVLLERDEEAEVIADLERQVAEAQAQQEAARPWWRRRRTR